MKALDDTSSSRVTAIDFGPPIGSPLTWTCLVVACGTLPT
jgi:hypothetical protein